MEEGNINGLIFGITILAIIAIGIYGSYLHHELKYENFQETIKDLSDEQKCMHICGFQYPSLNYFDQYKFCIEKCDRISERFIRDCKT